MDISYKTHDGRFADLDVSLVSSRVGRNWFCVRHRMRVGSAHQEIREINALTTNNHFPFVDKR